MPTCVGIFGAWGKCLVIELQVEVDPIRVPFLNEPDLPRSVPLLDLVFARFCSIACVMQFIPDETIYMIAAGESCTASFLMGVNSRGNVVSVATVQCAVFPARKQVDVKCHSEIEGQNGHYWKGNIETPQVPVKTGTHA